MYDIEVVRLVMGTDFNTRQKDTFCLKQEICLFGQLKLEQ
jgi:hypothetical protein